MRIYLAGPMTGIPAFNFPKFDTFTSMLRTRGFDVVSPHEADPEHVQEIAWASPDGDPACLPADDGPLPTALRNVEGVASCDGVALIPGWEKSSGTIHEIATATRFRIPVAPAALWLALGNEEATSALA